MDALLALLVGAVALTALGGSATSADRTSESAKASLLLVLAFGALFGLLMLAWHSVPSQHQPGADFFRLLSREGPRAPCER